MQPISYLTLIPFAASILYIILLIVVYGSRKNKIARSYMYYIIAMIVWSFGSFMMKTDIPPSSLFWNKILCVGLIAIPVMFYSFTLILTDIKQQKWILYTSYITAFILLIANFLGLIMKTASYVDGVFLYSLGPAAAVMAIWSMVILTIALFNIIHKIKKHELSFSRVKYILLGLFFMMVGGLLNLDNRIGKYPFDIVLNTLNAFLIAYAIYRFKFLEIKLIVKKGIAYSLYTFLLTGLYVISIMILQQFLSDKLKYSNIISALIVGFILAIVLQPFYHFIQSAIDRIFYREKIKFQNIVKEFSEITNHLLDLNQIILALMDVIHKGLKTKIIHLALINDNDYYVVYDESAKKLNEGKQMFNAHHPIVKWFAEGKTILTKKDIEQLSYFSSLWSSEKKFIEKMNAELFIPIRFRESLIGILILSENNIGEVYTSDEVDLAYTLVNHVAAVFDNSKLYAQAKQQAITDGLTKLYNHRYFHDQLKFLISSTVYETFSIAILDVDLFKFYNDMYGHSAGDRALVKIANVIKENTSKEDVVVRYGGEEFAIIYPNITGKESLEAIEKIRQAVENYFFTTSNYGEFITISAGVSNYPIDSKDGESLIDFADKAMYAAKQTGRNKAILFTDIDEMNKTSKQSIDLEKLQDRIKSAYISSVYALAATIDAKDHYTFGHSENVANLAVALAKEANFSPAQIEIVRSAGLLHDIGKIGIPENILTKPASLTKDEFEVMKKHVDISITIIKHIPNLIDVIPAIMSHHERYDGGGYPLGRKRENIPIEGRCLCIVDAFDAMVSDRPYRKALSVDIAIEELDRNKGTQFDPNLTELFVKMIQEGRVPVHRE